MKKPIKTHHKIGGRPSIKEIEKHKNDCKKAFYQGVTILTASEELDLNRETVSKYYKEFREKFIEELDEEFITEQKAAKHFAMKKLEDKVKEIDDIMSNIINDKKTSSDKKHDQLIKCVEVKSGFEQQRYNLEMAPTIDISIEKLIEEGMEEIEQSKSGRTNTR